VPLKNIKEIIFNVILFCCPDKIVPSFGLAALKYTSREEK